MNCQTNKISMLAFKLQNYNQQLLLFGGDFAIGKLRVFVSFVAHDLNYFQELEILAFRSAFDRKGNRSSSQVVFGHKGVGAGTGGTSWTPPFGLTGSATAAASAAGIN